MDEIFKKSAELLKSSGMAGLRFFDRSRSELSSMRNVFRKASDKAGMPPGELTFTGEKKIDSISITYTDYNEDFLETKAVGSISECEDLRDSDTVSWISIKGLHEIEPIKTTADTFGIHALTAEDVLNTGQRPKIEEFEKYNYIVMRRFFFNSETGNLWSEQVSLVQSKNYIITFQESAEKHFEQLRNRINNANGKIRKRATDYLAYAMMDSIVDSYFPLLEQVGDRMEFLEEELIGSPDQHTLAAIRNLRKNLFLFLKSMWSTRDMLDAIQKEEVSIFSNETLVFVRDVYDHVLQIIDTTEAYRDVLSSMVDQYNTVISNQMNQIMKVLTVISTIFIPLTFIAGVYGMNFDVLPELHWPYSYAAFWGFTIIIFVSLVKFFKTRKWL